MSELCKSIPHQFGDFIMRARKLGFEERPNYDSFRAII